MRIARSASYCRIPRYEVYPPHRMVEGKWRNALCASALRGLLFRERVEPGTNQFLLQPVVERVAR